MAYTRADHLNSQLRKLQGYNPGVAVAHSITDQANEMSSCPEVIFNMLWQADEEIGFSCMITDFKKWHGTDTVFRLLPSMLHGVYWSLSVCSRLDMIRYLDGSTPDLSSIKGDVIICVNISAMAGSSGICRANGAYDAQEYPFTLIGEEGTKLYIFSTEKEKRVEHMLDNDGSFTVLLKIDLLYKDLNETLWNGGDDIKG